MEKKKINYGLIIFVVVIVILFLPIIIDYFKSQKINILSQTELLEKIKDKNENFLVYVGEVDKNIAKELKKIKDKKTTDYSYVYNVYSVEENDVIKETLGSNTKVAFIIEGDIQKVYTEYDYKTVESYADIYFVGNITNENKSYKIANDYKTYKKLVNSENITMAIFGYSECYHCNVFKPIYNAVAEKYDVDIYYFESDTYDKDEYTKIVNMDLTVPAKCNSRGVEFKLSDGFGTPLTIFTQDGEVIDCISGRVSRNTLVEKLVSLKMISE